MSDNDLFGPRTLAVRQFLEAIQRLTVEQWREVIEAWRATVTDAWHEADSAVAAAVANSERQQAREELLSQLATINGRALGTRRSAKNDEGRRAALARRPSHITRRTPAPEVAAHAP